MLLDDPSVEDIAGMGGLEATGLAGLRDPVAALDCTCACHLRLFTLPIVVLHDEGRSCCCQSADERSTSLWHLHTGFHGGDDYRVTSATRHDERQAALVHALRYGMRITIECDYAPTIICGAYRGYEFWFHAPDDHGELHLDDVGGPVIAESAVDGPMDAVDFIRDQIDRYDRVASERRRAAASTSCGRRTAHG